MGAALLALSAACVYATYQILTRKVASEDPRVTLFCRGLVGAATMTATLPFLDIETHMPVADILLVCRRPAWDAWTFVVHPRIPTRSTSALTPFTYMQLVWAALIGWFVFQDFPDGLALMGMAVIAGSGLWIALYERRSALARTAELT